MRERNEAAGTGLETHVDGGNTLVTLSGDWTVVKDRDALGRGEVWLARQDLKSIQFDTHRLGRWDSSLLVYLAGLRRSAAPRSIQFDDTGIPVAARKLLGLLPGQAAAPAVPAPSPTFLERSGLMALSTWSEVLAVTTLVGAQVLRAGAACVGRARMRRIDLLACLYDSGIAALPMVALVNVLVGGILAFVGAIELRRFGADIYLANLVGIAQVREMAAVITAIVMSGRTGGAYAAEIASMQGSNELDALNVLGIPIQDYLIQRTSGSMASIGFGPV